MQETEELCHWWNHGDWNIHEYIKINIHAASTGFEPITSAILGAVSRKSRNFTGHFWVSQFPLYLKNGKHLIRQTSQLFFFLLP